MYPFSRFLTYFMEVARQKSIRRAAEELRIAGSAINRHILLAEDQLQTPLFERLPTGMRLTAAGELLYGCARRWMTDYDDLTRQIDEVKGIRRGQVDLLAPEALSRVLLPELIARVQARHPGVVLNISILENKRIRQALLSGEGDIALVLDPEEMRDLLVRSRVAFPLGFACPRGHPLARGGSLGLAQCAPYPVIVPEPPLALSSVFSRLAAAEHVVPMVAARANNVQMIKSLVAEGVGISFLSYLDVMSEVMRGELAFMPLSGADVPHLTLAVVQDRTRQLSRTTHMVGNIIRDIMTQYLRKMTQDDAPAGPVT
ncbi:LysR family transcriptional regulator [Novacetimonas pomaceti]|uniref:LysR family transcriptional regulator n=1 Tax=Novacetimonas pomaceti TaxID=2021998 RepID=A0A318QQW8_9PROT|nr:LysR family transcriptional regulator [Novacetimonas pomaceti]PYD75083.1 LysR family transcriptional regulator [Novacetimonas pomaceti]